MDDRSHTNHSTHWMARIARVGLIAKGIVYVALGLLAFMAAFEIGGQKDTDATNTGVFNLIKDAPGGTLLLALLIAGLVCYSIWRIVQAVTRNREVKWIKRLRYLFSALAYLSVAYTALRILLHTYQNNGDRNQAMAARLLQTAYGKWLVGALALVMAGIGIYQIWYGLSEKYKKHVQRLNTAHHSILLYSGKVGYVARGVVWLVVAYLLLQAGLHADAGAAGGSGEAFLFIERIPFGSYLLGATGIGLMAYGVFNFVRARYESF